MPSKKFMKFLYERRARALREYPWHFENPDGSPLCHRPTPSKYWDGAEPVNGHGLNTTLNARYVTCKRCLKIMSERGIDVNESA